MASQGFIIPKKLIYGAIGIIFTGMVGGIIPVSLALYDTIHYVSIMKEHNQDKNKEIEDIQKDITELKTEVNDIKQFMLAFKAREHTYAGENNSSSRDN